MCSETKASPEVINNLKLYGIKFTDFLLFHGRLSTMYISEIKIKQYIILSIEDKTETAIENHTLLT